MLFRINQRKACALLFGVLTVVLIGGEENEELSCSVTSPDGEHPEECRIAPAPASRRHQEKPYIPHALISWGDPLCVDKDDRECPMLAVRGDCAKRPETMLMQCPYSCALCNNHEKRKVRTCYGKDQTANELETLDTIRSMQNYMIRHVYADEKYADVRRICKNKNKDCSYWAATNQCQENYRFMLFNCAPACQSCDLLDYNVRCPFDEAKAKEHTMWSEPGDLNDLFWSLARNSTYRERYNLTVLSGPKDVMPVGDKEDAPWILQMEGFLTQAECNRLIALGHQIGYKRSKDIGKQKDDGSFDSYISTGRTSTTAWCSKSSACTSDPLMKRVTERIESLVRIPANNSEYMQFLKYEVGQKYSTHHDYSSSHIGRPTGVRILTVYLYLNDEGLQGGGTNFPFVQNLTVLPKRGRVVIWPSVLDDKPGVEDPRTKHQALPVEEGVKFGANVWIHERDFRTNLERGCAN